MVSGLRALFEGWGISLPWLLEEPFSRVLAPALFVLLCAAGMALLSPLVLRRKKAARARASTASPGSGITPAVAGEGMKRDPGRDANQG